MKRSFKSLLCCAAAVAALSTLAPTAVAQTAGILLPLPSDVDTQKRLTLNRGIHPLGNAAALRASVSGAAVPMAPYSVVASDGNTYTGTLVGTSPFDGSGLTTMVNTPIIPVVISVNLVGVGPYVSDPTASDPCLPGGSDATLVLNSPIFNSTDYVINGQDVGTTQYIDAFQRASFWALVGGTDYHLLLQPNQALPQAFNTFTQGFFDPNPSCGGATYNLFFEIHEFDFWVNTVALPAVGADPTQFPILLFQNVSLYNGFIQNCCVLGYHNANGGSFQTYGTANLDTAGFFASSAESAALSHEVGEWANDPLVNNATPLWGNIGQVVGCQNNLEVGDPLSGTLFPTVFMNGFGYNMQELAHFDWFFGTPSNAAGGLYSNNGTFTGPAAPCP
jgi:hypothetical protein